MGVLLAFCLLAAIGFVAYRKFDEKRSSSANPETFVTENGTSSDRPPGSGPGPGAADDPTAPPISSEAGLTAETDQPFPTPAPRTSTPPAMLIADSRPPEQPQPETPAAELLFDSPASFDPPPAEPEPPADQGTEPGFDPFQGATEDAATGDRLPQQPEFAGETSDPFPADHLAASVPEISADDDAAEFSSDATSPFGAPATLGSPEFGSDVSVADPPPQPAEAAAESADTPEMPVLDLFGGDEPAPAQGEEPVTPPAASPWGAPVDRSAGAETSPPGMLEPNDPQVMPTLTVNPFATADAEPQPEPPPPEPSGATGFDLPHAAAVTEVRESPAFGAAAASAAPAADDGATPVTQRAPGTHHDPFAPARDVSPAIREDEVVIHIVQTGDNFWKISQAHYGAGKYSTALAAYNESRIPDPRRMRPGMKVLVPSEATLAQQFPQLVSGGASTPYVAPATAAPGFSLDASGRPQYRVSRGDTLSGIAQQHLGRSSRWRQIYGMNRDQLPDANSLTTGMVLRLPADATQVRMDVGRTGGR
jgi:nucleoid-associated protein YgaU